MRKFYTLLLTFILVLVLAACGSSEEKAGGEGGMNLVEEGKFTFAASGDYRPFSKTSADGTMSGFDIDVANAIAEELGLEPVQKKFKFAAIVEGVKTGRFDAAVASHTITPARSEQVNFSTPYYYSGAQIFTRTDSEIQTLDDLKGKEIGVSKGSTYAKIAKEVTDNVKVYDSDVVALQSLSKGHHDAVITDFLTGKEAIANDINIKAQKMIERSEQAVAINKESPELLKKVNEALQTLRENGTLKKISEKYFGEYITTKPE